MLSAVRLKQTRYGPSEIYFTDAEGEKETYLYY